ncbi:MAG: hypothetical protein KF833_10550 [Verrucomicrobiae bacterium]|nr:hypothetical protein [Verrucomicrobiae bacterium]
MSASPADDPRLAAFPPALRALLDAELAAGNRIIEVASCFPAPPAGAYAKLAAPVTTRPRASDESLRFHDHNSSCYAGEFTDARRFHFVLEPPRPPEPEVDMDALRAAREASYAAANARALTPTAPPTPPPPRSSRAHPVPPRPPASLVDRFKASMVMDYEKWHDGTGYDLALIRQATDAERALIEELLVHRSPRNWRDVEALSALGHDRPRVRAALLDAFADRDAEVRLAVHRHAPGLLTEQRRIASLVAALEHADFYAGLTQALMEVRTFHPPPVIEALWRGLETRAPGIAVHFAALLCYLHGQASSPFDMSQRPYFLSFHTDRPEDRLPKIRELRDRLAPFPVRPHET